MKDVSSGLPKLGRELSDEEIETLQGPACMLDFSPQEVDDALAFGEKQKTSFFRSIGQTLRNAKSRWL